MFRICPGRKPIREREGGWWWWLTNFLACRFNLAAHPAHVGFQQTRRCGGIGEVGVEGADEAEGFLFFFFFRKLAWFREGKRKGGRGVTDGCFCIVGSGGGDYRCVRKTIA